MIGVNALGIIALMPNNKPPGYRPFGLLINQPVNSVGLPGDFYTRVAVRVATMGKANMTTALP